MNKRGAMWGTIGTILIVLVVVLLIIFGFKDKFIAGLKSLPLSATEDFDNDLVADLYDKCVCIEGSSENSGCPFGAKVPDTKIKKFCGCNYETFVKGYGIAEEDFNKACTTPKV